MDSRKFSVPYAWWNKIFFPLVYTSQECLIYILLNISQANSLEPQIPNKLDPGEWTTILTRENDPRVWPTKMTHDFDPQCWPARMTHKFGPRVWQTSLTHENDPRVWPTKMTHECNPQKWPTSLTHEIDPREWPTRMTHENDPRHPCDPLDLAHSNLQAFILKLLVLIVLISV